MACVSHACCWASHSFLMMKLCSTIASAASAATVVLVGKSEYVQGLTLDECATLLNIDVKNQDLMNMVYDTAFAIKNRIYGNRIVLFAPLYIANYCVNSCTYCAFRAGNKSLKVRP